MKRKKFENVDVLVSLEAIMKQNTAYFQEDLECDRKIILERAGNSNTDDKTLLWLSRDTGTECLRERDVFIKGTVGHEIWCYHAEPAAVTTLPMPWNFTGYRTGGPWVIYMNWTMQNITGR